MQEAAATTYYTNSQLTELPNILAGNLIGPPLTASPRKLKTCSKNIARERIVECGVPLKSDDVRSEMKV